MASTPGATGGSFTIPTTGHTETNVWYRIYLTVQDSNGLTHTTQRDILPRKVRLTLATSPAGLQLSLDGQPVTTPFSFDSVVGIARELEAPSPQTSGGLPYGFLGWSDGGAARHTIAVPSANTTYTATYGVSGGGNGLVAAYGFNEGSGGTTADATGKGHTGSLAGATWTTAGKNGNALAFNGTSNLVSVADAPNLDFSTGLTLEAWVRPTTLGGWRTVAFKEAPGGLAYTLYAQDNAPRPGGYIDTGGGYIGASGSTALPLNTWTHLAMTYDGATVRLYVNGAQVGVLAASGALRSTNNPLTIGGNIIWSEWFAGQIDDLRIYNRALSAGEITTDMNTSVGTSPPPPPPPSDTTPPARSNGQPAGTLAAGTTQATLSLTTSESATCRYGTGAGVAYGSLPNAFTTTGGTAHATTVTGLVNGASYTYFVRCQDGAGNANPDDFQISFAVAQPVPTGLRAAYGFDDAGGTSVSDASGNGLTGAIAGATWTTSGQFAGALSFDGNDDRVSVGSSPLLNLTTGTVEAWVRLDTLWRWHGVLAKGNANTDRDHNYAIEIDEANFVNCVIGNGSSSASVRSTNQVAAQQFYHLACTWNGSQLRLYINGALNRSVSQGMTAAGNSSPLFIGQYGGNVDRFDGVIDEVRIYSVALSQAQIQTDMNTPVR